MDSNNIERIYRLTPMQEGMLYHKLLDEQSTSYFVQNVIELTGDVHLDFIKASLQLLTKKHSVLRTKIFYRKIKDPRQIVLKHEEIGVRSLDFRHFSVQEQEEQLEQLKKQDVQQGFDLEKDVLMRVIVVRLSESTYKMIWSFHHIIMDGWCMSLVVKDFMAYYDELIKGKQLGELTREVEDSSRSLAKYEEYIQWLSKQNKNKALHYWKELLQDYSNDVKLGLGYKRPDPVDTQICQTSIKLEKDLNDKLSALAVQLQVTENTIVEAAWGILLQRLTGEKDVVFGKVVSGRNANIRGIEEVVGLFINTIPVRVENKQETKVQELVHTLQAQAVESGQYDYCSLPEIQAQSQLKGNLMQSILAFENYYADNEPQQFGGLSFQVENLIEQTNYPLSFIVFPEETLRFEIMHDPNEYSQEEIEHILRNMQNIIEKMVEKPDEKVNQLDVLLPEDEKQIIDAFNPAVTSYPKEKPIHTLWLEQVQRYPEREAVVTANERVSYAELEQRANQLWGELQRTGVKSGSLVGIVTEKSVDMVAGLLAILKHGCGYVPLEADYPAKRLHQMMADCQIETILCGERHWTAFKDINVPQLLSLHGNYQEGGQESKGSAHDAAYVIFTSGSTGQPKGVIVEHHNVVRLVKNQDYVALESARVLQTGALSFDASTFEIWGPLLNGGTVALVETDIVTDPAQLRDALETYAINTMWMTAQLFNNLVDLDVDVFTPLESLLIGGEKLSEAHVERFLAHHSIQLINGYGPTENTTFSLYYPIQPGDTRLPIGRPLQHSSAYILQGEQLSGIGMPGELCVGGDGVARGYLNQPALTAEKFVANPYQPGDRLYRTGDLARWLPDGTIEYLGRIDDQVKIRGYRIEPGEIEQVIKQQAGIQDVAVLVQTAPTGEPFLAAYVVYQDRVERPDPDQLKTQLRTALPDYMIPTTVTEMDQLPVTRNGKLDHQALPVPTFTSSTRYVAPKNEREETLVEIFQTVLGVENISTTDDFFALGGHSLRATRLVNVIEAQMGIRLPLKMIFDAPTIAELSEQIEQLEADQSYEPIPAAPAQEYYKMSSPQKRLYIIQAMEGAATAYNIPGVLEMKGTVDRDKIETVCQQLVDRHEILRTSFHLVEGEPVQKIADTVSVQVEYEENDELTAATALADFVRPFNVEQAPLFRVKVVQGTKQAYLLFDLHHLIADGESINLLTKEFSKLYRGESLEKQTVHYKDYSEWMQHKDLQAQKAYWVDQFREDIPILDLPTDFPRPAKQSFRGATWPVEMTQEIKQAVQTLTRQTNTTEYMVFLAAFMVLLQKYSGQEDIVVGSPISGRTHRDTEGMLGMFVNTLALRGRPTKTKTFGEFLTEIKQTTLNAYEHQEYPFEDLVEAVEPTRDLSRNPLFDCMLILQNQGQEELDFSNGEADIEEHTTVAKFDLTLNIDITEKGYLGKWEYSTELFQAETIKRMANQFHFLLSSLVKNESKKIKEINILSQEETQQLLHGFNYTKGEFPKEKTIASLFEEQVKRTPEQTAVIFKGQKLTYEALNRKANRLARTIKQQGNKHSVVGILMNRQPDMFVAIMAVLKAGAAYLPIDPTFPSERIKYMLTDSEAKVLLTDTSGEEKISDHFHGTTVNLDQADQYSEDSSNIVIDTNAEELAYLIYTSGSTGKPKGVMIQHRSIVNLIEGITKAIDFTPGKRILNITTISFDIFVVESLLPLVKGMQIVLVDEEQQKDTALIREAIAKHQVNMLQLTPSRMKGMLDNEGRFPDDFRSLTEVIVGGEALPQGLSNKLLQQFHCSIYNLYGPSETTVWSTMKKLHVGEKVTIGKPILNTDIYIVDEEGSIQPIGVKGELCIGGEGVAKGYWQRPELTAEKFVILPHISEQRIYRTGDLARWLPDGNVEYLGRLDHQVKIRGFRIELGEIEHVLKRKAHLQDVAVIARNDEMEEQVLCAYYVENPDQAPLNEADIKTSLGTELPDYMIPTYFVKMDHFPLNKSGKLDRHALPEPDFTPTTTYVAPQNDTEAMVVEIYQEVLGREEIGVNDHFFQVGGHSLRATRVINLIETKLDVRLPLITIFEYPTVRQLSEQILKRKSAVYHTITKVGEQAYYPVSSQQKRLYLIHEMGEQGTVYNMPALLEMAGQLDREKVERACAQLSARHEALRTTFTTVDGEPVQHIASALPIEVEWSEHKSLNEAEAQAAFTDFVRPFDLAHGPLFRVKVLQGPTNSYLFFDMHHIISDGESINILTKEFSELYNGTELAPLTVHYKDYSHWLAQKDLQAQKDYWVTEFADEVPVLDLPTDYPRPRKQSFQGATLSFTLGEEIKKSVRKLCEKTDTTEYMVFLSAFMVLLQKYSGQEDVVVGSPISGRLHHDTETMLGMFVNTLAMRGQPEGEKSFNQFLQEMKETTIQAYEHQEYPFEELVEQVDVQRDLSRNPIFDHMLVLQNQENNELPSHHKGFRSIDHDSTIAKFDLTLNIDIEQQGYVLQWEYCTALFQEQTIRRMAERMTYLLQSLSEQLTQPIEEISLITEKERQQVLADFNPATTSYPKEKTIHALWLEQVQRHPQREAVVTANERVSYAELEQRANPLWGELQRNGVKPGTLIGIATEKSVDMIAGLLAILKHGCGYVPLEADYPTKRLHQMIEDCQIETVLCGERHWTELEAVGVSQLLPLHGDYQEGKTESKGSANDVAYVIFTSGSTGQPKGVMVEHRNVVRLVKNQDYVELESARVLQTGALSFDASTFEIWGPLLNGGTVALVETEMVTDPLQLRGALETYAINTMWMTAQLFNNLVDLDVDVFAPLDSLLIGGEKLSEAHVERFLARHSTQLINGYGPTENTTFSLYYPIQPGDTRLPIGRPLQHSSAYILQGEQLAGVGMPGELCVGGDGVARGYLNQPVLTAEKFVANPYQPGERLYRTGDLARWLPDGTIEYLGRIDDQVKIRGFRIELGEIEQVMKQQTGIQDVAVLVQTAPTGEPFLSAYVVYHDRTEKPDPDQLKAQLRWELPDYMIPATVTEMDQLPVTRNGKLNHQALPVPTFTSSTAYAAPENEREELLVAIYQEVLGLEKIGIDDPFFEIGGDSIKAIRIISKMREVGFELDYEMMFQEKTIRGIANKLKNVAADQLAESQKTINGLYELSPIQHEFLNWSFPKPHHFNQAIMLYTQEKLEDNMVDSVLNELVIHHDMLRAVLADGKQRIRRADEDSLYKLKVYDLEHITSEDEIRTQIEGECESIQASIDLENGPLFQVALYHTSEGTHLFICVHHFVMDGVSWRILLEDFTIAYSQLQEKEQVKLPLKTMAYPDWQQALIAHGETYVARQEIPYWEGVVDTLQTIANPSFVEKGQDLFSYDIEISEEFTSSLLYEAGRAYNTEINELLLSALGWALYKTAGIKQVGIELEGHGRYPLEQSVNIDRTIGWFTNIYPVILEAVPDDIGQTIKEIKERLRNVPNNGLTYGVFKHLVETKIQDKQKQLPLGISFNYLGNIHENESGMFESSTLHPGKMSADENDHGKSMTINGVIEQKRLRFTIQFRSSSHDQTLMKAFCTHFEDALKAVINHCLTVEEGQFTKSDYGDHVEWDENELEDVLELYVGEEND